METRTQPAPPSDLRSALQQSPVWICPQCDHVGWPTSITRGSFLVEIALWFFFLVPGLIYSLWRLTTKVMACAVCRQPGVIPVATPRGRQLYFQAFGVEPQLATAQPQPPRQRSPAWSRLVRHRTAALAVMIAIALGTAALLATVVSREQHEEAMARAVAESRADSAATDNALRTIRDWRAAEQHAREARAASAAELAAENRRILAAAEQQAATEGPAEPPAPEQHAEPAPPPRLRHDPRPAIAAWRAGPYASYISPVWAAVRAADAAAQRARVDRNALEEFSRACFEVQLSARAAVTGLPTSGDGSIDRSLRAVMSAYQTATRDCSSQANYVVATADAQLRRDMKTLRAALAYYDLEP